MTNKLPVVGRRYKLRNQLGSGNGDIVMVVSVEKDFSCKIYFEKFDRVADEPLPLASFCNICEELPEDNLHKPVDFESKEVNEVERALKKLKLKLHEFEGNHSGWCESQYHYDLFGSITNLINALDNQEAEYMSKSEPKTDIKQERIDPVSIWKLLDYNKKYKEKNSNKMVKLNSIGTAEVMFRYEGKNYNEGEYNKCSPSLFLKRFEEL